MDLISIINHLKNGDDVDLQLEDFDRLNEQATAADSPFLLQTILSKDAGIWTGNYSPSQCSDLAEQLH